MRKLRSERGWNVAELGERAGVDKMTVSRLERGEGFRQDSLDKIAVALGFVNGVELFRLVPESRLPAQEAERTGEDIFTGYKKDDIPIIVEGHASPHPNLFWSTDGSLLSEVSDRMSRPTKVKDPHAYGIRVIGDSMFPRFKPGEKLIASPRQSVQDGDEVYVELLSGERLIKEARRTPGGWLLVSYNALYPPRVVKTEDIGAIHPIVHIQTGKRGRYVVTVDEERAPKAKRPQESQTETSDLEDVAAHQDEDYRNGEEDD